MKRNSLVFVLIFFLAWLLLPQAQAGTFSETRYFRASELNLNYGAYQNVLGFMPYQAVDGTPGTNFTMTPIGGNKKFQVGMRVWMTDGSIIPNETEITGGTPQAVITRDVGDTGIKALSAQWNCSLTNFNGNQTFNVKIYKRYIIVGSTWSGWTAWATPYFSTIFFGLGLGYQTLASATWNVTYYTQRIYTTSTYLFFLVGNSTWNSHIENITYDNGIGETFATDFSSGLFLGAAGGGILALVVGLAISKKH